jgi:hypothetical protein
MDFYIDMATAIILRLLKDKRQLARYRDVFIKVAASIMRAYELDQSFSSEVAKRVGPTK